MTAADFRRIALSLEGVEEYYSAALRHMGKLDLLHLARRARQSAMNRRRRWTFSPCKDASIRLTNWGTGHARALSIIASQMPLDLRMSSTVSRIAP